MAEHGFAIPERSVTHERLDDEVIAINLETGFYYALVGTAADVWSAFDPVGTVDGAVAMLSERYGAPVDTVRADVEQLTRRLHDVGLLVPSDEPGAPSAALPEAPERARWETPDLEEYRDMADLVLLDPIHQVDEKGWPHPLPEPQA